MYIIPSVRPFITRRRNGRIISAFLGMWEDVYRHRLHTNDEDVSFKQSRWFVVIAFTWPQINLDTINSIDFNFISVMCRWDYITFTPSRILNYKSKGERVMKPFFVFCQLTVNQFIVPWNGQEMATHWHTGQWNPGSHISQHISALLLLTSGNNKVKTNIHRLVMTWWHI